MLLLLRTWGSLVDALPREIILQWEGQETARVEITVTQLKRMLTLWQKG